MYDCTFRYDNVLRHHVRVTEFDGRRGRATKQVEAIMEDAGVLTAVTRARAEIEKLGGARTLPNGSGQVNYLRRARSMSYE